MGQRFTTLVIQAFLATWSFSEGYTYPLDVALVPIGGVFTMDAYQVAEAVRMLNPRLAVPIHYASFPIIAKTAEEFVEKCSKQAADVAVIVLSIGKSLNIENKK
jgi:L-ascorbate metabolism protein UlaG (beta-lactamase superfamily)